MNRKPRHPCSLSCLLVLGLVPCLAAAQIYRCETPQGLVFADAPCGETSEVVELEESTSGISGGPSEEVREYLALKRQERSDERQARREAAAAAAAAAPPPQPVVIEQPVAYPGFWGRYPRPRPPGNRPPRPERPIAPVPDPGSGDTVLRPGDR